LRAILLPLDPHTKRTCIERDATGCNYQQERLLFPFADETTRAKIAGANKRREDAQTNRST